MTGYGHHTAKGPGGSFHIEIQTLNRKHLDISLSLPRELSSFDPLIRRAIGQQVLRGQVSLRCHWIPSAAGLEALLPDPGYLAELRREWEKRARLAGFPPEQIDLPFVLSRADTVRLSVPDPQDEKTVFLALEGALSALDAMRLSEGKLLAQDIASRLAAITKGIQEISRIAPEIASRQREKLKEKLASIAPSPEWEERVMREAALYAEKGDIAEEITRLNAHLAEMEKAVREGGGKKMEFLVQEMGREANTIAAKAADYAISHVVIEIKTEIERIREQVQNIE
jgi:uncharacterized protein (TIGR00255 family)